MVSNLLAMLTYVFTAAVVAAAAWAALLPLLGSVLTTPRRRRLVPPAQPARPERKHRDDFTLVH